MEVAGKIVTLLFARDPALDLKRAHGGGQHF